MKTAEDCGNQSGEMFLFSFFPSKSSKLKLPVLLFAAHIIFLFVYVVLCALPEEA